jgi:hypothetical protein
MHIGPDAEKETAKMGFRTVGFVEGMGKFALVTKSPKHIGIMNTIVTSLSQYYKDKVLYAIADLQQVVKEIPELVIEAGTEPQAPLKKSIVNDDILSRIFRAIASIFCCCSARDKA